MLHKTIFRHSGNAFWKAERQSSSSLDVEKMEWVPVPHYPGLLEGPMVLGFWLHDGEKEVSEAKPEGRLLLDVLLSSPEEREYPVQCYVTFWDRGTMVARCKSEVSMVRPDPEFMVTVDFSPLMLRRGEYDLTISIYGDQATHEMRYDIVPRCLKLKVAGEASGELFRHPAAWEFRAL